MAFVVVIRASLLLRRLLAGDQPKRSTACTVTPDSELPSQGGSNPQIILRGIYRRTAVNILIELEIPKEVSHQLNLQVGL
jgi:hypothetical protein